MFLDKYFLSDNTTCGIVFVYCKLRDFERKLEQETIPLIMFCCLLCKLDLNFTFLKQQRMFDLVVFLSRKRKTENVCDSGEHELLFL